MSYTRGYELGKSKAYILFIYYFFWNIHHGAESLIVKELDLDPVHPFLLIYCLFLTQYQLYEELLQLLIAVVDAELLKAVHKRTHDR